MEVDKIREHMEVVSSDGKHLGTVDHLEDGGRLKLTRSDPVANNQHHWISVGDIDHVDDRVHLRLKAEEAKSNMSAR